MPSRTTPPPPTPHESLPATTAITKPTATLLTHLIIKLAVKSRHLETITARNRVMSSRRRKFRIRRCVQGAVSEEMAWEGDTAAFTEKPLVEMFGQVDTEGVVEREIDEVLVPEVVLRRSFDSEEQVAPDTETAETQPKDAREAVETQTLEIDTEVDLEKALGSEFYEPFVANMAAYCRDLLIHDTSDEPIETNPLRFLKSSQQSTDSIPFKKLPRTLFLQTLENVEATANAEVDLEKVLGSEFYELFVANMEAYCRDQLIQDVPMKTINAESTDEELLFVHKVAVDSDDAQPESVKVARTDTTQSSAATGTEIVYDSEFYELLAANMEVYCRQLLMRGDSENSTDVRTGGFKTPDSNFEIEAQGSGGTACDDQAIVDKERKEHSTSDSFVSFQEEAINVPDNVELSQIDKVHTVVAATDKASIPMAETSSTPSAPIAERSDSTQTLVNEPSSDTCQCRAHPDLHPTLFKSLVGFAGRLSINAVTRFTPTLVQSIAVEVGKRVLQEIPGASNVAEKINEMAFEYGVDILGNGGVCDACVKEMAEREWLKEFEGIDDV
ncbi:hypothetical protein HDU97_007710 [Phlyctochytrium planicorne]|nr:hypothetical protein HDU97_007710 [Phlyctochytrium planicorne]